MYVTKPKIYVMQSRLSPKYNNQYQCFPADTWQKEFELGKLIGIDGIEFIFDDNPNNPLNNIRDSRTLLEISLRFGVEVKVVCADYFMKHKFFGESNEAISNSIAMLNKLIVNCYCLGVNTIVIPCVDESIFRDEQDLNDFCKNIQPCLDQAAVHFIDLCVETNITPQYVKKMILKANHSKLKICYDVGNSIAVGNNIKEDLEVYGHYIKHVHLKDRLLFGKSVDLFTGDVDFIELFDYLQKMGYSHNFTYQGARAEDDTKQIIHSIQQYSYMKKVLRENFQCQIS